MVKKLLAQIGAPLGMLLCLMVLIAGILAAFGQLHMDTNGNSLGFYSSGDTGLPSYHNPLINRIWFTEPLGLFALPAVLFGLRKRLHAYALPWLFAAFGVLCRLLIWRGSYDYDPEVSSALPSFLDWQIPILIGLAVGSVVTIVLHIRASRQP